MLVTGDRGAYLLVEVLLLSPSDIILGKVAYYTVFTMINKHFGTSIGSKSLSKHFIFRRDMTSKLIKDSNWERALNAH